MLAVPLALWLAAAPQGAGYRTLDWEALGNGRAEPGLVRVTGRYLPHGAYTELVRGVVAGSRYSLRVEGQTFDWMPKPGETVELWGRLETDEQGPVLRFHNGRGTKDARRAPRPSPELKVGERTQLWVRVLKGGSQPFPMLNGITEDGVRVMLPPSSALVPGVMCLEGTVGTLGNSFTLREPGPCPKR